MMETQKKVKYEWANKLSYYDRQMVVAYYLEGYGLYHIGVTFGVTTSTIEYHLKKANVFIPRKKPTLFGNQNPIVRKVPTFNQRTLTTFTPKDNYKYYFDEFGERYNRPKSYAQLLRQYMKIQAKKQIMRHEEPQSNGFTLRVSLVTGEIIEKNSDGSYSHSYSVPQITYSTSLYSI